MSVNKVQLANGETIIDISDSTVTPETLAEGVTAHDASGKKITGKMIPGGGTSVQTDWNQMDETAPDFLKNKPFGDELVEIIPETEVVGEYNEEMGAIITEFDSSLRMYAPDRLCVSFDGVQYNCSATVDEGSYMYGNFGIAGGQDTGEPFFMLLIPNVVWVFALYDSDAHNVSISEVSASTIDPKYLPNSTEFFWDFSAQYLYKDVELTTKATMKDVLSAVGEGFVIKTLMNGEEMATIHPSSVIYQRSTRTYAVVEFVLNSNIIALYTAEYTPET